MKIKHSKYKNTGILFELLVRQITADTLDGKDSQAKNILKDYFVKTELGREYKFYDTLFKKTNLTEAKSTVILSSLLDSLQTLNRGALKRQKYNLINEIKKHYDLTKFFRHSLPHYKVQAAFYTLSEIKAQNNPTNLKQEINNKITILEHLSSPSEKEEIKQTVLEE
jgi:predicted glycosyltransferase